MSGRVDLTIQKGETFSTVFRWGAGPVAFKAISAISKDAPARVTAEAHGLPEGWLVAVVSAEGMDQINASNDPPRLVDQRRVSVVDVDNVDLRGLDSSLFDAYTEGGFLRFMTPVDLDDYTAEMPVLNRPDGTALLTLTSAGGDIVIDNTGKTITVSVSAADTAALEWTSGWYRLRMTDGDGAVRDLAHGQIKVVPQ